jgi:prepilin-type N-terminal cleavage/methylation domain-containing protein
MRTSQAGFSVVELIIVLVVVGLLGFTSYSVNKQHSDKTAKKNTAASQSSTTSSVPTINSTSDLDKAEAALDQTDIDSSNDSSQLDSQLQAF